MRDDERERRALVSTLIRSFGLSPPISTIGEIVSSARQSRRLSASRGVSWEYLAYQTYSAMLGAKLPHAILQTNDVDIAQFQNVSVAVEDKMPPVLDVLREVDKTFTPIPHVHDQHSVTSYQAKNGLRVGYAAA